MLNKESEVLRYQLKLQKEEREKQLEEINRKLSIIDEYHDLLKEAGLGEQRVLFEPKKPVSVTDKYADCSLPDAIIDIMESNDDPKKEWLTNEIQHKLELNGKVSDSPNYSSTISTTMRRMVGKKLIKSKAKGRGNKVAYRLLKQEAPKLMEASQ